MDDALFIHRIHFAFTITYHYIFPQLTMGLAPLIVILKTLGLRTNNPAYDDAARFWTKVFGINFLAGVVTGIPMEFQFGKSAPKEHRISTAGRRHIAAAQRKRWAALKKSQAQGKSAARADRPKKRKMSAAARKRIGDAARKRWAAYRKAGKKVKAVGKAAPKAATAGS